MDTRKALQKNDILRFPGLTCVIESGAGRGSNVIVYIGRYADQQNPELFHRILIRELFPYDPKGGIFRDEDGSIRISAEAQPLYELNRLSFLRGNEVHLRLLQDMPSELDLNINTFEANDTLYTLFGYSGGRSLEEELAAKGRAAAFHFGASGEHMDPAAGKKNRESLLHVIRIMKGALSVLDAFHEAGYLHLDISPDNILLIGTGEKERVTLIDYNSVHTMREIQSGGPVFFSMKNGYTAPEVQMGRGGQIGPCTDLYSMTAVLYRCLTGERLSGLQAVNPVSGLSSGLDKAAILQGSPETVRSLLLHILQKGLSVTPRRRYQRAAQLRADLEELEERILGRGITRWALWEAGRERVRRMLRRNKALNYLLDAEKVYPLTAETADGQSISLKGNDWIQKLPSLQSPLSGYGRKNTMEALQNAPLLLLGSGGMGKTTALLRIACEQKSTYTARSRTVYYVSLYGYQGKEEHYIADRLLESLKFQPHTDSMESARRELLQLLDCPLESAQPAHACPESGQYPEEPEESDQHVFAFAEKGRHPDRPPEIEKSPWMLLLLDGFNEASGDTAPLLREIHAFCALSGVQVILTGRSDPGDPHFRKLTLCRLAQAKVQEILSGEGILPPENVEVLDLLGFPMMLSMYIQTIQDGERQIRIDSRRQLLEDYFSSILEKEKRSLPDGHPTGMGLDAAVNYLLPEIAAWTKENGRALTGRELLTLVEKCYREIAQKAITAVYPEWIGHAAELRLGAATADEWYGRAVLEVLWKRTGLLVRDEQGDFRILHQMIEDCLADRSRDFHRKFDEEKRRQRNWRNAGIIAAVFLAVCAFAVYSSCMYARIAAQQQETLRNESLALASSSESDLRSGDRAKALREARDALVSGDTERPFVEEAEYALSKALHVYETGRYHPCQVIRWSSDMLCSAVSPDGNCFVLLDEYGKLSCYSVNTGKILWSQNTAVRRNSSISRQDITSEKGGYTKNPEQRLPYLDFVQDKNAVLCIGEKEPGLLISLSDGEILWRLSDRIINKQGGSGSPEDPAGDPEDSVWPENAEYSVETADISDDGKSLVLGICAVTEAGNSSDDTMKQDRDKSAETAFDDNAMNISGKIPEAGPDDHAISDSDTGTDVFTRYLYVFDLETGACTAKSGPVASSPENICLFSGRGDFSNEGNYYIVLRDWSKKQDSILCLDPFSGAVTRGASITIPWPEGGKGVTGLLCRDRVYYGYGEQEGEIYQEQGVFYYSNEYDWDINAGYSGKAMAAFAADYAEEWAWSKMIELPGDADRFPGLITYDSCSFLLSGNTVIRLDDRGEEQRVILDRRAVCFGREPEGEFGQYVFMVNEDGTADKLNLYTMQTSIYAADSYALLENFLRGADMSGITPVPLCLYPDTEHHTAVICRYFEDNRICDLENPEEYPYYITGVTGGFTEDNGFIYLKRTPAGKDEEGHTGTSVHGAVYEGDGTMSDSFDFETIDDYLTLYSLQLSADGSRLYGRRGPFQYNLKNHCLEMIDSLPESTTGLQYSGILSAETKSGVLSAYWDEQDLTLWNNTDLLGMTSPDIPAQDDPVKDDPGKESLAADSPSKGSSGQEDYVYKSPLALPGDSVRSFQTMTVGENGLIVLCGSRRLKKAETIRGTGFPVDDYLIYDSEKDKWSRISNAAGVKGFPAITAAKDHPLFAAMDEANEIIIYDADAGGVYRTMETDMDIRTVADMQFILDDQYLAVLTASGAAGYEILRIEDGETVYTYQSPEQLLTDPELVIREDLPQSRLFIMSKDFSGTGVCVNIEKWKTECEIPFLCCVLNDNSYVVGRQQELVKYPFYTLEELLSLAEEELAVYER